MTVGELIERLQNLDPTLPVVVEVGTEGYDDMAVAEVVTNVVNYDDPAYIHAKAVLLV